MGTRRESLPEPEAITEEKSSGDEFDEWSRERALKRVQLNQSLKRTKWYKLMQSGNAYLGVADKDLKIDPGVGTISALTGEVTQTDCQQH